MATDKAGRTLLIVGVLFIAAGVASLVIPMFFEVGILSLRERWNVGRPLRGDEQWLIVIDMFLGCVAAPFLGLFGVLLIGVGIGRISRGQVGPPTKGL